MNIKKILSVIVALLLMLILLLILWPSEDRCKGIKIKSGKQTEDVIVSLDVYVENSSSMDGYVSGMNDFKSGIYNLVNSIHNKAVDEKGIRLNYINKSIIPIPPRNYLDYIRNFTLNLTPYDFSAKGGDRGTSDISSVIKTVVEKTEKKQSKYKNKNGKNDGVPIYNSHVSILISDFMFSMGKTSENPEEWLKMQQNDISGIFEKKLTEQKDFCVLLYKLESNFNGIYYDKFDNALNYNGKRPFYIWIMGSRNSVSKIMKCIEDGMRENIQKSFCVFTPTDVNYKVRSCTKGSLSVCSNGKGKHIIKAKAKSVKSKKGENARTFQFAFKVAVNYSSLPLDDEYLCDISHYKVDNEKYRITKIERNTKGGRFTHYIYVETEPKSENINSVNLKIDLCSVMPIWIEESDDGVGANPKKGKTWGLNRMLTGVYNGFSVNDNNNHVFTTMNIYIN